MKKAMTFIVAAVLPFIQVCAQGEFPPFGGFEGFPGMMGFPGFGGGEMPDGMPFGGGFDTAFPEGPTGHVDFTSSNLPVIQIDTDSLRISQKEKIQARMKITDHGKGKRNLLTDTPNAYDGFIGIKIRGNSSAAFTQKRFTLELRDAEGHEVKHALLGMPADKDWVLLGPYNDRSMMRDALACDLWTEMGHWGSRSRYAELLLNGEYRGVYLLMEKIKAVQNRVNIHKHGKNGETQPDVTGGYILRIDAPDAEELTFASTLEGVGSAGNAMPFGGFGGMDLPGRQVTWSIFYPKKKKITAEQEEYIKAYIAQTEQAIADNGNVEKYIDLPSFVDYFIHTELSLNADGFKRSAYFYKDRSGSNAKDGLLHAGPVWDYNLAYGNCNFCGANDIYGWVYQGCETNPTPAIWKLLAENKTFMAAVRKRYAALRSTLLSEKSLNQYIDQHAQLLQEAQARHFAKYPTLLKDGKVEETTDAPNETTSGFGGPMGGFGGPMGGFGGPMGGGDTAWFDAYEPVSYEEEIHILKTWLHDRLAFLDSQWKK